MERTPVVTTLEQVQRESGYQSLEPVQRPAYWGIDRDPARRPGVPMMRAPETWPHTRFPPALQGGTPSVPKHGRPNKPMPPVFGTAVPLHGVSGAIRRLAYRFPDHYPRHWLLLMLGDRVDAWGHRFGVLAPFAIPLGAAALAVRLIRANL